MSIRIALRITALTITLMAASPWMSAAIAFAQLPRAATGGSDPRELFRKGFQSIEYRRWSEATSLLQRALDIRPEDLKDVYLYSGHPAPYAPHFYLSKALMESGRCTEAREQRRMAESSMRKGFPKLDRALDEQCPLR